MTEVRVRPENIPEELKDRDQWLLWDKGNETPRRPHWDGNFGISWSDPDDWHTFDEAIELAESVDSWGVGYVMSADNDRHARGVYACLDLDGCVADGGGPKEWLPSIEPLFGDGEGYAEYSPSGEGIHIPVVGHDAPEWWSDSHFTADEHEGVEYLTNKFVTFTGDKLDGAADGVTDADPSDFLWDAYEELNGEKPDLDVPTPDLSDHESSDNASGDEWLTDDLVRDALDALDPDMEHDDWVRIGFAVHDYDSGGAGRRLFTQWSQGGSKYDNEADRQIEWIWENASEGGGVSVATLVEKAKESGWDVPSGRAQATADGGAVAESSTSKSAAVAFDTLEPDTVRALTCGEDENISDLNDREKAAAVWEILTRSNEVFVRVRRDNGGLWAYDEGIWRREGERALRHAARKALGAPNYGGNVLEELKTQARADPAVEVEADRFGLEPGQVAVENGLLDLEAAATGGDAIRALKPTDYALTKLPVEYDSEAGYDEWGSLVEEWAEEGYADALQEYVGYCLHVGGMPIHRALLLVGSGANGKGTFLSVVRDLLGDDNTTSIELQTLANDKDAVAQYYGSVANIDDDLSSRKLGAGLGMFKKLVAGDRVRGRHLYEDAFEFTATGKQLYAANEVPQVDVSDEDEAFWRRWLLVEFPNHYAPSERDPHLKDRLSEPEPLSGVLNWAIEGWHRLMEQQKFTGESEYAIDKRERWQAWGDSVDKFIEKCVEDDGGRRLSTGDVHRVYAAWCRENGERPGSQQKLTSSLKGEDVGYGQSVRIDGTVQRGYKRIGLTDEAPELDETPERGSGQQSLT